MAETLIEWCDRVWNFLRGCTIISPGCKFCYAMKQGHRFSGPGGAYEGLTEKGPNGPRWTGKIRVVEEKITDPLHVKKPQKWFVNSMSDLFHEGVPFEVIDRALLTMIWTPQHTYQILTKRPARMLQYFSELDRLSPVDRSIRIVNSQYRDHPAEKLVRNSHTENVGTFPWPLPNVWLGVSAEDQQRADERIPLLLQTPAAVRFVSYEPALGPINFKSYLDGVAHESEEQRGLTLPASRYGNRDRFGRSDLAYSRAQGRSVEGRNGVTSRQTEDNGAGLREVPASQGDAKRQETIGPCASAGVPTFQGSDSLRNDGESRGREQASQSSGQFNLGNGKRTDRACHNGIEDTQNASTMGPREFQGQAHIVTSNGNQGETQGWRETVGDSTGFRSSNAAHIQDRHGNTTLSWIIIGGESGPGARPFKVEWARSVVQQCKASGAACFVKQMGSRPYSEEKPLQVHMSHGVIGGLNLSDSKGGDPEEWPADLRIREFPR